jgi:hypothetical protein
MGWAVLVALVLVLPLAPYLMKMHAWTNGHGNGRFLLVIGGMWTYLVVATIAGFYTLTRLDPNVWTPR